MVPLILDDQTQMDLKSVSQPEHASLNQCQLIATNRSKCGVTLSCEMGPIQILFIWTPNVS